MSDRVYRRHENILRNDELKSIKLLYTHLDTLRNIYSRRDTVRNRNTYLHVVTESRARKWICRRSATAATDFTASYSNARQKLRVLQVARALSYARHSPVLFACPLSGSHLYHLSLSSPRVCAVLHGYLCNWFGTSTHVLFRPARGGRCQRMRGCVYTVK